jgi:hypothetical protein
VDVVDGEVDAVRPLELVTVLLDGLGHDWVVDHREQLLQVVLQDPVVEHLVAIVQSREEVVPGEVCRLGAVLLVRAPRLLLQGGHAGREEAVEAERGALLVRERRPVVEARVPEQGASARDAGYVDPQDSPSAEGTAWSG